MPLVTSKELLLSAQKDGYAVGAFNVENLEMVQAVVSAAEELRSPVILQTTPSTVKYADLEFFYAMTKTAVISVKKEFTSFFDTVYLLDVLAKSPEFFPSNHYFKWDKFEKRLQFLSQSGIMLPYSICRLR